MKRRVTYITAADAEFDPSKQAILNKDTLAIGGLDAAKEERFTFSPTELPTEVRIDIFLLTYDFNKADNSLRFGENSF